jgi:DNA (cytosine-5)-methyltransferase 1
MNAHLPFHASIQLNLDVHEEIIVDLFAGGGGNSYGIEMALGRRVDVAINHNPAALSMHQVNHPETRHLREDIRDVHPREATSGRPVGLLHLSPDCRDHTQAKGGQPRSKEIRGLTWQGKKWAGSVAPRVITLENVTQILRWGPLIAKRDKATGRVVRLDGSVADPGERVPLQEQFLIPDPKRAGRTWLHFVRDLRALGYAVETRKLCAADFGAPTTRERLFMVARRDGRPIVWPAPTHAKQPAKGLKKWRAAAECIDWSIPCPSIFTRKKPLAEATLRRIAVGIRRYVLENADPFIVPLTHQGGDRVHDINEPVRTVTGAHLGEMAVVAPVLVQAGHGDGTPGRAMRWGSGATGIEVPLGTVTASGGHALGTAFLAQMNGGFNASPAQSLERPMTTVTTSGSQQQMVAVHLTHLRGNCEVRDAEEPLRTISAGGEHHGVVSAFLSSYYTYDSNRCRDARDPAAIITTENRLGLVEVQLSEDDEAGALRVASFLMRYYGEGGQWSGLLDPMATITTRDRLALVTVVIKGTPYVIVDVGLRMLSPRELYRAQGFPDTYVIDRGHDGKLFTKSEQVHMCGNSVCPPVAAALVAANVPDLAVGRRKAA